MDRVSFAIAKFLIIGAAIALAFGAGKLISLLS
jgi:hypothetical protein